MDLYNLIETSAHSDGGQKFTKKKVEARRHLGRLARGLIKKLPLVIENLNLSLYIMFS